MQKVIKDDERWGVDRQVNTGSIYEFKYNGMGATRNHLRQQVNEN